MASILEISLDFNSAHDGLYNSYWSNGEWVDISSSNAAQALGKLITSFPY